MYIPNPQLWRPLRLLLLVFLAVTLVLSHRYLKSRPSYILYKVLSDSEVEQSHNLIRNARGNPRYVLFKQLQGAGFNNQVSQSKLLKTVGARYHVDRLKKFYCFIIWHYCHPEHTCTSLWSGALEGNKPMSHYLPSYQARRKIPSASLSSMKRALPTRLCM